MWYILLEAILILLALMAASELLGRLIWGRSAIDRVEHILYTLSIRTERIIAFFFHRTIFSWLPIQNLFAEDAALASQNRRWRSVKLFALGFILAMVFNAVMPSWPKMALASEISVQRWLTAWDRSDYFGEISPSGKRIYGGEADAVGPFMEGVAAIRKGVLWGYVDASGRVIAGPTYLRAYPFSEGLGAVFTAAGWRFINRRGNFAFDTCFDGARPFTEGLAAVSKNGYWGYINKNGQSLIPCDFRAGGPFRGGLAPVILQDGANAYIDRQGRVIWQAYLPVKESAEFYRQFTWTHGDSDDLISTDHVIINK